MSWLNRVDSLVLHQVSDVPYVILDNGVLLCFDNFFSEQKDKQNGHSICFKINKKKVYRKSTFFYSAKHFPVLIPFKDVISLDDVIKEGIVKASKVVPSTQVKNIVIVKNRFLKKLSDHEFDDFIDEIDDCGLIFILNTGTIDERVHVLKEMLEDAEILFHTNWHRTIVSILDKVCDRKCRKLNWTKSLPDLNITCVGMSNTEDMDEMNTALSDIGVSSYSTNWL